MNKKLPPHDYPQTIFRLIIPDGGPWRCSLHGFATTSFPDGSEVVRLAKVDKCLPTAKDKAEILRRVEQTVAAAEAIDPGTGLSRGVFCPGPQPAWFSYNVDHGWTATFASVPGPDASFYIEIFDLAHQLPPGLREAVMTQARDLTRRQYNPEERRAFLQRVQDVAKLYQQEVCR